MFALKLSSAFPQISKEWLLTGEGEMLCGEGNTQRQSTVSGDNVGRDKVTVVGTEKLVSIINRQQEQIDRLIGLLERKLGEKP
ncbi:MAG: hypothetical protein LUC33_06255 [Prevotellaceae bacterium]|nr:hypothetical protein [Prevotellaceae bacterium]